jgi:hypothetical protein
MFAKRFGISILVSVFIGLPTSRINDQNVFSGACSSLPAYIALPGVADDGGVFHPDNAGWTNSNFKATWTYTNQHRVPGAGRQACFGATAHITYTANPVTSTIRWDPVRCDSCACNAETNDWQGRLPNHETIHAPEANAIAARLTRESRPYDVSACASAPRPTATWLSVKAKFDILVYARARGESRRALRNYMLSQDSFDKSATGQVPLPDCTKCPTCALGQVPACKVCSAGLILYQGKCNSPCGPLLVNGTYQNCGFSAAHQPVACCAVNGGPTSVCSPLHTSDCPPLTVLGRLSNHSFAQALSYLSSSS